MCLKRKYAYAMYTSAIMTSLQCSEKVTHKQETATSIFLLSKYHPHCFLWV